MKTILKNLLLIAVLFLNSTCSFSGKESAYNYPTFSPNDFTSEVIDRFVDKVLQIEFGSEFTSLNRQDIENRIINGPISYDFDVATADTLLFLLLCNAAYSGEHVWEEYSGEYSNGIVTYSRPERVIIPKFNLSEIEKQNFLQVEDEVKTASLEWKWRTSHYTLFWDFSFYDGLTPFVDYLDEKREKFAEKWGIGEQFVGGQSAISSITYPDDETKRLFLEDYRLLIDTCEMLVNNQEKFELMSYTRNKERYEVLKDLAKKREKLGTPYLSKTVLAKSPVPQKIYNEPTSKTVTKSQNPQAISIEAGVLHKEYQENEVLADQKYKGKILSVSGVVEGVKKGYHPQTYKEQYYVTLRVSLVYDVRCFFTGNASEIAQLKSGQNVVIKGTCIGKELEVCLDNCSL